MKPLFEFFGLANALEIDADGWAFIPFGDTRHSGRDGRTDVADKHASEGKKEVPVIQRFDRAAALALVNDFESARGAIRRATIGVPIYKGHPDAPRFAKIWPDKSPRGTIADMKVADTGLKLRPVLTEQGATDVRNGCDEFSPYWYLKKIGEENGTPIVSPFRLVSVGIVPHGNMPGLSLVNAAMDEDDTYFETMKQHVIKLLAAMGKPVAADADDAAINAAVETACPTLAAANAAEGQLATIKTEKATLETKLSEAEKAKQTLESDKLALANAKTSLEGEVTSLKTKLADERKASATALANAAVTDGRLPGAERDATVTALCNAADFSAEVAKLAARQKVLPTRSTAKELGELRGPEGSRAQNVLALVNARMDAEHIDYETAFSRVQADPKHAELFAAMKPAKK